ncbi:MAG: restriction endonuclease [Burkholderiaceae bacterium]|nr:restriction endonuclease [Burkholderiaceae bacterium]
MAEPSSTTAVAIAAGTVTLSGSIFGVQYDALLAGFFGGLVSLSYLPPMSAPKIAGTVAGSALLAGFFAPVIAAGSLHYFPWLLGVGDFTRLASGAALGIAAQVVIPAALQRLRSLIGG